LGLGLGLGHQTIFLMMDEIQKAAFGHWCSFNGFNHLANCRFIILSLTNRIVITVGFKTGFFKNVDWIQLHQSNERQATLRMSASTLLTTTMLSDYNQNDVFIKMFKLLVKFVILVLFLYGAKNNMLKLMLIGNITSKQWNRDEL
jgi:hypothetical protein